MIKSKSFIRRAGKGVITLCMLAVITVNLTGCGKVDNGTVNRAFAGSAIMRSIYAEIQNQKALILDLETRGIIPTTMANGLIAQLDASQVMKGASDLVNSGYVPPVDAEPTDSEEDVDEDAALPPVEIGSGKNEYIAMVISSMTALEDGPAMDPDNYGKKFTQPNGKEAKIYPVQQAKQKSDANQAAINVVAYGSPLNQYQGYNTKDLIQTTDYKNLGGIHGKPDNATPLYPYGVPGADNSSIEGFVAYLNNLNNVDVYYVNPDEVSDTHKLIGLKQAMDSAKQDESKMSELTKYFYDPQPSSSISFTNVTIKDTDIYKEFEISVKDIYGGTEGQNTVPEVAKYKMWKLDIKAIEDAVGITSDTGDLSSGVLIGNKFFVTRYPMAIFRGFQSTTDPNQVIPIFTHPYFLSGTTYKNKAGSLLKGSIFTGSASGYTESFTTDKNSTAETKCAYVDLYRGTMYYKDEGIGNSNAYMSVGLLDLESSVVVKPSNTVYLAKGNPTCITTIPQSVKFTPSETWKLSNTATVKIPSSDEKIMPVVFLMDYLELVYSPNIVGSDAFTAYGRKVRLDDKQILGTSALDAQSPSVAYIVGEGAPINFTTMDKTGFIGISVSDFIDIDGIYSNDASLTVKSKDTTKEANDVTSAVRYIKVGDSFEAGGAVYSGDAASERSDTLPQIAASKGVECVLMFGATGLNAADSSSPNKTALYGITLYGGLYDRGLFSNWINTSGNANLTKWGQTVKDLGYPSYVISDALLTEKLKGNYAFELNQEGLLNIDLNTVVQINKELTEERRGGGVIFLRTSLLILGFGLVAYVSVLLAAWSLDVNLDLGFNMLEKVSFGHFVAVRSLDEMPDPDPDSTTTYVDYKTLIFRCLAFAAVGVILITIDPVNLIVKILGGLNFLFKVISEKLFGTTIM